MNPDSVLNYLEMISNKNIYLNLTMHMITMLSVASLYFISSQKMRTKLFNGLILILTASVTVNAFINGNPFHLVTFAVLTGVALMELVKEKNKVIVPSKSVRTGIALMFLLLGIWYPEFVATNYFAHLLLSPMGIIPCPTLIVILSLFAFNPQGIGKLEYITVLTMGVVYALIGVFVLKVYLDIVLLLLVLYSIYILVSNKVGVQMQ